jgi:hypothetical protein
LTFSDGDAPPSLSPDVERGRFASGASVGVFATAGPLAGVGPGGSLDQSTSTLRPTCHQYWFGDVHVIKRLGNTCMRRTPSQTELTLPCRTALMPIMERMSAEAPPNLTAVPRHHCLHPRPPGPESAKAPPFIDVWIQKWGDETHSGLDAMAFVTAGRLPSTSRISKGLEFMKICPYPFRHTMPSDTTRSTTGDRSNRFEAIPALSPPESSLRLRPFELPPNGFG